MTKKRIAIRSLNNELILGLVWGLFFLGFNLYIFIGVIKNTESVYFTSPFIIFIILLNLLNSLKVVFFYDDYMLIRGDFGLNGKIQMRHKIFYNDIEFASFDKLEPSENSANKKTRKNIQMQYIMTSRYSVTKCISFHLKNGEKAFLVINKYTKNQIKYIIEEIKNKNIIINNSSEQDAFIEHHSNNLDQPFEDVKVKYPFILGLATVLGAGLFFLFFYLSMKYGGSAESHDAAASLYDGFVEGKYYLVSHGNYTEVSFKVWDMMRILEKWMIISFLIMFVGNAIYQLKSWKKLKKS